MKKSFLLLLYVLVLYAQALYAQTVYKGTDAQGNVIYSDKPFPNSQRIEIAPIQTFTPPPLVAPPPVLENQRQGVTYQISIVEPADQETFPHSTSTISVTLSVSPPLQRGDHIILFVNGEPYGPPSTVPNFELRNLYRGAYQLEAEIVSPNDRRPKAKSNTITIYQQRATVNQNKNRNN